MTKAKGFLRVACDGGSLRACMQMATFAPESATQLEIDYVLGRYLLSGQDYGGHRPRASAGADQVIIG